MEVTESKAVKVTFLLQIVFVWSNWWDTIRPQQPAAHSLPWLTERKMQKYWLHAKSWNIFFFKCNLWWRARWNRNTCSDSACRKQTCDKIFCWLQYDVLRHEQGPESKSELRMSEDADQASSDVLPSPKRNHNRTFFIVGYRLSKKEREKREKNWPLTLVFTLLVIGGFFPLAGTLLLPPAQPPL